MENPSTHSRYKKMFEKEHFSPFSSKMPWQKKNLSTFFVFKSFTFLLLFHYMIRHDFPFFISQDEDTWNRKEEKRKWMQPPDVVCGNLLHKLFTQFNVASWILHYYYFLLFARQMQCNYKWKWMSKLLVCSNIYVWMANAQSAKKSLYSF